MSFGGWESVVTPIGATTAGWANAWLLMKDRERTVVNDVWLFETPGIFPMLVFILVGIALVSLYFMFDIRRTAGIAAGSPE